MRIACGSSGTVSPPTPELEPIEIEHAVLEPPAHHRKVPPWSSALLLHRSCCAAAEHQGPPEQAVVDRLQLHVSVLLPCVELGFAVQRHELGTV